MIKPEQVPEDVWVQVALRLESCGAVVSDAVAKIVAAEVINTWPGMGTVATEDHAGVWRQIILPLPQEESGDE